MEYTSEGIPIIDISPSPNKDLASQISKAMTEVGSFYARPNIDFSLVTSTFNDFLGFFSQPIDYKMRYLLTKGHLRGYVPFETQNVNAYMGRPNFPNDPVERLVFGPPDPGQIPKNIYPDIPESLQKNVDNYYNAIRHLANDLMTSFSMALCPDDPTFLYRNCHLGQHIMKANFYPSQSTNPTQMNRFPEHTDSNLFTILATDSCKKALMVQKNDGQWIFGNPVPGTVFVNSGHVLQILTNEKWKATVHKVVWPEGDRVTDRLSVAYFVVMNGDAMVKSMESCIETGEQGKYQPMTYGEYYAKTNREAY